MKQFHAKFILPFNTTIPKHSQLEKVDYSKKDCQLFDSTCAKICTGNGICFYFNDDGKLDLYYILKTRYLVIKSNY